MTTTKKPSRRAGSKDPSAIERTTTRVVDAGAQVGSAASEASSLVGKHVPAAVAASRGAAEHALATVQRSSSGSLLLGAAFATGITAGMRLSRAPRVLVALASLPALLLGATVFGRSAGQLEEPPQQPLT